MGLGMGGVHVRVWVWVWEAFGFGTGSGVGSDSGIGLGSGSGVASENRLAPVGGPGQGRYHKLAQRGEALPTAILADAEFQREVQRFLHLSEEFRPGSAAALRKLAGPLSPFVGPWNATVRIALFPPFLQRI